ncbi:hypothetical protein DNTS_023000, partial [Danionella cerebrum]
TFKNPHGFCKRQFVLLYYILFHFRLYYKQIDIHVESIRAGRNYGALFDGQDTESTRESRSKDLLAKLQEQVRAREKQNISIKPEKDGEHQPDEVHKTVNEEQKETEGIQRKKKKRKEKSDGAQSKSKKKKNVEAESCEDSSVRAGDDTAAELKIEEVAETPEETKEAPLDSEELNSIPKSSFHILQGSKQKKVQKVKRVLPQWLAQPDVIQRDVKSNLVPINEVPGICPALLNKLQSNGIQSFFPVQAEVIPALLESMGSGLLVGPGGYRPRDVCVSAPTGSGKTLAFALSKRVVREIRALVVLPTKELAQQTLLLIINQVAKVFCTYTEGTGLRIVTITGKKPFAAEEMMLTKTRGGVRTSLADIVVATPGRLVDHINQNSSFSLRHLRFLIIDEADRMVDHIHQFWLSEVTKAVYRSPGGSQAALFTRARPGPITVASLSRPQMPLQKLLFSATLTKNPEKLQLLDLHQPRLFSSTHHSTASQDTFHFPQGLSEYYVPCSLNKKPLIILHFLLQLKFSPLLCFTNSRQVAHRLYLLVKLFGGVEVAEFSSQLSPSERQKTLTDFERGKIKMLISTDAAARGIDVTGVKCVVNYDAPQYIRTYIHRQVEPSKCESRAQVCSFMSVFLFACRVGRTARAGHAGLAFTFLLDVQVKRFVRMVLGAGSPGIQKKTVLPSSLRGMESSYEQTLAELEMVIKSMMVALGNSRRGGRSPSLLMAALIISILLLGFNYWVSSSRNIQLQGKILELEDRVRQVSVEREREQQSKRRAEEETHRQSEHLEMMEETHQRQQQSALNSWKQEKEILELNISSSAKAVQEIKNRMKSLLEDVKTKQSELKLCQSNMDALRKQSSSDVTRFNQQMEALKEECSIKIASDKQEAAQNVDAATQKVSVSKAKSDAPSRNHSSANVPEPVNKKLVVEGSRNEDQLQINEFTKEKIPKDAMVSQGPSLSTAKPTNKNETHDRSAKEDTKEDALNDADADIVLEETEDLETKQIDLAIAEENQENANAAKQEEDAAVGKEDAIMYNNEGEIEKQLSKIKDESRGAGLDLDDLANYNGDDDNQPEAENEKQAELAGM